MALQAILIALILMAGGSLVCIGLIAAQKRHRITRCPHRCTGTTITAAATCETFTTRCLDCGALINEYTDCV